MIIKTLIIKINDKIKIDESRREARVVLLTISRYGDKKARGIKLQASGIRHQSWAWHFKL